MEEALHEFATGASWTILILTLVAAIAVLGKSADTLVDIAVDLSLRWGIPSLIVGATVVSLGTTLPEVVVSVLAAIQGKPGLAIGNAVGSIICDTGLIMGVACMMAPIPLNRKLVNRQGWIQLAAAFLLVLVCFPFSSPGTAMTTGGVMTQYAGFFFLFLLVLYMIASLKWAKEGSGESKTEEVEKAEEVDEGKAIWKLVTIAVISMIALAISSQFLVTTATEMAVRISIPESVIAATIVAFGTSLPELVTAITAVRKGHGELAVGNVIGADILNALLVAGAAASVTPQGLMAGPQFFTRYFPAMMGVLIVFRIGIFLSKDKLSRGFGVVLFGIYVIAMITSYA